MGQVLPGLEGCHQASGWPGSPGGFAKQLTWISFSKDHRHQVQHGPGLFARGLGRRLLALVRGGGLGRPGRGAGHTKPRQCETDGGGGGR